MAQAAAFYFLKSAQQGAYSTTNADTEAVR
jgi:hypothetical protein